MQQYLEIKQQYQDCILFFRLGDFYEMFFEDAVTASREMEVTLTGKNCGMEEKAPMCGVPYHAADTYIAKLVEKGYKVAVCEQTEDPASAKGIVKREVIKIVTPGTLTSQSMLNEKENNYLACVFASEEAAGLAYCDISTGELKAGEYRQKDASGDILNELIRIDAMRSFSANISEIRLFSVMFPISPLHTSLFCRITISKSTRRSPSEAPFSRQLADRSRTFGFGFGGTGSRRPADLPAETQKSGIEQLTRVEILDQDGHMALDKSAIRNLELTETLFEKKVKGSLLGVLDKTQTAMDPAS